MTNEVAVKLVDRFGFRRGTVSVASAGERKPGIYLVRVSIDNVTDATAYVLPNGEIDSAPNAIDESLVDFVLNLMTGRYWAGLVNAVYSDNQPPDLVLTGKAQAKAKDNA